MSSLTRIARAILCLVGAAAVLVAAQAPVTAAGPSCATPGRDGTVTLTGVVNTYYPGAATAAAGATTITLGTATGATTPMAVGDLVLVIQMQDAAINFTNTGAYGDGIAGDPATGSTSLNSAGLYEYAVATSAVPLAGGSLTISSGLVNTYNQAAPVASQGQRDFQVIRVPQYAAATLGAALTAGPFNGSTGGVLVLDVAGSLNLNGNTASVSQEGFRAGLGRQLAGAATGGTGTDYVNLSANPFHGQKGEGIAGTPQYVYDSRTATPVNSGVDGYPNGSTARGAPGTAGGGGTDPHPLVNDENTGGGGGANGGTGGHGGNSWKTNVAMGGFGGTAFPATATRVTAGAGGGAGSRNNSPGIAYAGSGGNGGGIVMIRAGSVTGTGTVSADGGSGVVPDNDGGGGGGAGGTVVVVAQSGGMAGLTVSARGGAGTNTWPAQAGGAGVNYHGPGGGGGGGVVLGSSAAGTVNVSGGLNGTTTTDAAAYGATPGAIGSQATILASSVPGAGSGATCAPDLTLSKSHTDPVVRGSTGVYTLTAHNIGLVATSGLVTVTDAVPAGLTPTTASGTGWTCGIAAQTVTCTRSDALGGSAAYPAITVSVAIPQGMAGPVTNTASISGGAESNTTNDTASDPTTIVSQADVGVTKTASRSTVTVGSNLTYTISAHNAGPSDATGVQVTDLLPTGLTFVSSSPSVGSYAAGTGVWNIGAMLSGSSATLTVTATVTATGTITNTATKSAEVELDPNSGNNSASASITGQPTAAVPGPPSSGMAIVAAPRGPVGPLPLVLGAGLTATLVLLAVRRRSRQVLLAAVALSLGTMVTVSASAQAPRTVAVRLSGTATAVGAPLDLQLFGKAISTEKPFVVGAAALHPAAGPITPTRIRIPALNIDANVEKVGVNRKGSMDVPNNIWNAAWLRSSARPGTVGQAVIDGHLDSILGDALFINLHKLAPDDKIYVSDASGGELTFRVTATQVSPLNGFPALKVFGPSKGRFLNLITCAGHYDAAHRTYDHRLIVFTTLSA
ncbi:MAG: sortase [Candidatus Dormibacteraeota bacterium]|nr:sortase [Candidatus Dormibacteraeota bacterium]